MAFKRDPWKSNKEFQLFKGATAKKESLMSKARITILVILGNEIHLDKNVGNKNENEEKTDGPIDSSKHCPVENEDISRRCDQAKDLSKMFDYMPFGMFSVKKS